MMFGVPNLTEDMVRQAIPFIPEKFAEEIRKSESSGHPAWLAAVNKYKVALCKVMGIDLPESQNYNWRQEFNGILQSMAKTNRWPEFTRLFASGDWESIYASMAVAPKDMWQYIVDSTKATDKLSNLNATLGSCTPKLCKLLMDAPKDIPFTLFMLHAGDIPVDEVPDVPLSFMDDFPEQLDSEDYNAAFMTAYVISCLRLFFDADVIDKKVASYTAEELRRFFPKIVWEISGHSFYDNETVVFDTVTNW